MLTFQFIENAAIGVGHRVVRLKLDGAVIVGERVALVLQALIDGAAVEDGVVGIELDRPVEVGERGIRFADVLIDKTTIGVDRRAAARRMRGIQSLQPWPDAATNAPRETR